MNPNDIIQIGPLVMALDRLVAMALILGFLAGMDWIVRRFSIAGWQPAGLALLAGLVGARAAYVWIHRESFALDPVVALQVWLGGWVWSAGVATAAVTLVVLLRRPRPIAAGLALLGMLSAVWWAFAERPAPRSAILLPASLRIDTVQGSSITAGDLRGRPAVLNLWASWCPPCRREMPMLIDAANRERRAAVLLVNQGELPATVHAFLEGSGLSARHVALDQDGILGAIAGSPALPTTLFVAADGTIRQAHVGEISRVQLDIAIRALSRADGPQQ
ncbi:TlpA disulfide reductase family protein [Novosphingobium sp.]|uniref:TlpA disulfide reductase family protein n=1 Tax=Novosphingobium sp. TaxID=1874826 RepID=UPI002734BA49|nr:TlpA disulfide reductase family protein [Novosphingobium sp.]MDP3908634.1 TlpA disulfide reductase family protein [Novosphingobium sp.]